jgi:hypothetical protein
LLCCRTIHTNFLLAALQYQINNLRVDAMEYASCHAECNVGEDDHAETIWVCTGGSPGQYEARERDTQVLKWGHIHWVLAARPKAWQWESCLCVRAAVRGSMG